MRVVKDPFTGDLLLSLDSFESKQVKEKGYVKISTTNNYFDFHILRFKENEGTGGKFSKQAEISSTNIFIF